MDPITGALAASGLKAIFDSVSTVFQNKYNSPVSQLRRLRKAGLPLSYMYQGRVNQQSDSPKLSIDPSLGVAQKIQLHQQDEVNKAQISRIGEEIERIKAETSGQKLENVKNAGEQAWRDETKLYKQGDKYVYRTNQERQLDIKLATDKANKWIAIHNSELKGIALQIAQATKLTDIAAKKAMFRKIGQQIKNLVAQEDLMIQLHGIRGIDETVNETLTRLLDSSGDPGTLFYTLIVKLFSKL